jgi:uridylate kinase
MSADQLKYKRVLLKLSGESLAGDNGGGISPQILTYFVQEVKKALDLGVEIAIVIGGGNIFRGLSDGAKNMDRTKADDMGMLATTINALALEDAFNSAGVKAKVLSSVEMPKFADYYTKRGAAEHLKNGTLVILSGGTGNPFFTTDTAAVLRAVEINAEIALKGTRVDGVYDADPEKVENAEKFDELTYSDVLKRELKVMDLTAISLANDNQLPIIVFNFNKADNLKNVILGKAIGTKVQG